MGRPQLLVGTYGSISTSPYGTGYRARTLYRDYDGVTRRVERHWRAKGAAERALRMALRDRVHVARPPEDIANPYPQCQLTIYVAPTLRNTPTA